MAIRGKRPDPTYLKLVKSARKSRLNKAEAQPPRDLPEAPDHLTGEASAEWDRCCDALYKSGLLTSIDRAILVCYVDAWARLDRAERILRAEALKDPISGGLTVVTKTGRVIQHPVVGVARRAAHDVARFATELGMTPSARSRVTVVPPPDPDDPAARYFLD
jgi:P27 family predicted phage terminase small subunit